MRRLGVVLALALALAGCGGSDDGGGGGSSSSPESETFTASGSLFLISGAGTNDDGSCSGDGGYDDIDAGASVTVTDSQGDKVALGELGTGTVRAELVACEFPFKVEGIPAGSAVYTVSVSHRGGIDFSEDDATGLKLSLGSVD